MERIIDIHTHMLYGIDDGSENLDMTLKLMQMDYEQGARGIFLTNHSYYMEDRHELYPGRFDELKGLAEEKFPELSLYKGCEVLCYRKDMKKLIERIRSGAFPTLNSSDYVLMEFEPNSTEGINEMTYCLKYAQDAGYVPVVAHVERYKNIYAVNHEGIHADSEEKVYADALDYLQELRKLGCLFQINLYSVEQDEGTVGGGSRKRLANMFLENDLVDFVGTDTHRLDYKSPEAKVGAEAIRRIYGDTVANKVLYENAERMLIV